MHIIVIKDDVMLKESDTLFKENKGLSVINSSVIDKNHFQETLKEHLTAHKKKSNIDFCVWNVFRLTKDNLKTKIKEIKQIVLKISSDFQKFDIVRQSYLLNLVISLGENNLLPYLKPLFEITTKNNNIIVNKLFLFDYQSNSDAIIGDDLPYLDYKIANTINLLTLSFNQLTTQSSFMKRSLIEVTRIEDNIVEEDEFGEYIDNYHAVKLDHIKSQSASFNIHIIDFNLDQIATAISYKIYNEILVRIHDKTKLREDVNYSNHFSTIESTLKKLEIDCTIEFKSIELNANHLNRISKFSTIDAYAKQCFERVKNQVQDFTLEFEDSDGADLYKISSEQIDEFNQKNLESLKNNNISLGQLISVYKNSIKQLKNKRNKLNDELKSIRFNFRNYIDNNKREIIDCFRRAGNLQSKYPKVDSFIFHSILILIIFLWNSIVLLLNKNFMSSSVSFLVGVGLSYLYYYFLYKKKVRDIKKNENNEFKKLNSVLSNTNVSKKELGRFYYLNRQSFFLKAIVRNLKYNLKNLEFIRQILEKENSFSFSLDKLATNLWRKNDLKKLMEKNSNVAEFEVFDNTDGQFTYTYRILSEDTYSIIVNEAYTEFIEKIISINDSKLIVSYIKDKVDIFLTELKNNILNKIISKIDNEVNDVINVDFLNSKIKEITLQDRHKDFPFNISSMTSDVKIFEFSNDKVIDQDKLNQESDSIKKVGSEMLKNKFIIFEYSSGLLSKNDFDSICKRD